MKEPVLVVMAAGIGSRYGGLKQIDPVGSNGELIIDFSLYDAIKAGFKKVVFIIKEEIEKDFKEVIGDRMREHIEVAYAYQRLDDLPASYHVPRERSKPWGTGHALLAVRDIIEGPFAVINADDYYGQEAFSLIYEFLKQAKDDKACEYGMVGYELTNTLTEHGYVARGVCEVGIDQYLYKINERTHIEKRGDGAAYTEDGEKWIAISNEATVSMNMWAFTPSILKELEIRFPMFLEQTLKTNPEKGEYFLPDVVGELIEEDKACVKVLKSQDKWYGVTYKEDKPLVVSSLLQLKNKGFYPLDLWEANHE
ncbi:MAG: nucleotidyltransferase [Clostridia bacterium]|jgi:dTDP-glucose pyrophosphorylase|nr:nucleotidyltransferase [Clostridia bacterium]